MDDSADACRVVVMGMMGSGKTTVGRLLAAHTDWPFHDNDALLERLYGQTAKQLLATGGEAEMRDAEAAALELGLECEPPCIVGAAAGTILDEVIRRRLRSDARVVWLRAAPSTLAARAVEGEHRPWLDHDPVAWMQSAADARHPLYESLADLTVDTDERQPAETFHEVLEWLRQLDACRGWITVV